MIIVLPINVYLVLSGVRPVCVICPCVLSVTPVTPSLDGSSDHWTAGFVIGGFCVLLLLLVLVLLLLIVLIMLQVERGASEHDRARGNPCDGQAGD